MRLFGSVDRKALGVAVAVFLVVYLSILLIAGPTLTDAEMILAFWVGFGVSLAVGMRVMLRNSRSARSAKDK